VFGTKKLKKEGESIFGSKGLASVSLPGSDGIERDWKNPGVGRE